MSVPRTRCGPTVSRPAPSGSWPRSDPATRRTRCWRRSPGPSCRSCCTARTRTCGRCSPRPCGWAVDQDRAGGLLRRPDGSPALGNVDLVEAAYRAMLGSGRNPVRNGSQSGSTATMPARSPSAGASAAGTSGRRAVRPAAPAPACPAAGGQLGAQPPVSGTQSSSPSRMVARGQRHPRHPTIRVSARRCSPPAGARRRRGGDDQGPAGAHDARHALGEDRQPLRRPRAAISSTSSSSRCVFRTPAYGRTASTSTPSMDSAAVISASGSRPPGSSTTRSSIATPRPRSTTSTLRMSSPDRAERGRDRAQRAGSVRELHPDQEGHRGTPPACDRHAAGPCRPHPAADCRRPAAVMRIVVHTAVRTSRDTRSELRGAAS